MSPLSHPHLPTTNIEGHEIARFVVGSNWFLGYSHQTAARDKWLRRYQTVDNIVAVLKVCSAGGMNALVAVSDPRMTEAKRRHEEETGDHLTWFTTPGGATTADLLRNIDGCAELGAEFCLPHVSWTDPRVHAATNTITDYEQVAAHIRGCGMIPGLSTHRPDTIVVGDRAGYDIATYIQPYNALGFLCSVETDWVARVINGTPKPIICIKPLGAGRINPLTGLSFVFSTVKPTDMVCIGLLCEEEAQEDLEIVQGLLAGERVEPELQYTRSKATLMNR